MNPYTTHELLELASLDVLGLLDAEERESFELAFRAAAPALQAQIRREQTRLAGSGMDPLLPQVETPLGLRARVLNALREAMQSASARHREPDIAGRIIPHIAPSSGVNRWWRAGAIGAAAASIVFGFAAQQMRSDNRQLAQAQENNMMTELFMKQYGPNFEKSFLSPQTRFVQFTPAASTGGREPEGAAKAMLVLDQSTKKAQLFLKNLASDAGQYSLVIIDNDGKVTQAVLDFRPTGNGIERREIPSLDLEGVGSLAIIENGSSRVQGGIAAVLKSSKL